MANDQHIKGLDGVLDALKALPQEVAGKNGGIVRQALASGARLIRDEARQRAPRDTGAMAANIVMKRDRDPKREGANERYTVGVRGGARRYAKTKRNVRKGRAGKEYETAGNTYYWRFIEFGTERQKARPFLRPAFEVRKVDAREAIINSLQRGIARAAKRVARAS